MATRSADPPSRLQLVIRLRVIAALAATIALVVAGISMHLKWHEVDAIKWNPEALAGALYLGPDYRPTAEIRAQRLASATRRTPRRACMGVAHLGGGPGPLGSTLIMGSATVVLASLRRRKLWGLVAFGGLVATALFTWVIGFGGWFGHLFERVYPSTPAEQVFSIAAWAAVGAAAIALLLFCAECLATSPMLSKRQKALQPERM